MLAPLLMGACACGSASSATPPALRFHVAPMQGFTNSHLRFFLRELSQSAVLWTEMEKADDLLISEEALVRRFIGSDHQSPVVLQLGGSDPQKLWKATAAAIALFDFDEINLNCGCPTVQSGLAPYGAALMLQPKLACECLSAIRDAAGGRVVSVKCRVNAHQELNGEGQIPDDSFEALDDFVRIVRRCLRHKPGIRTSEHCTYGATRIRQSPRLIMRNP
mmetsp:Transcript_65168/g.90062  ORF Transcript_65168/g.90062 Transcript_65168/m.90062 type:complete len:220 (-) Transcript_65168:984-1643(-)